MFWLLSKLNKGLKFANMKLPEGLRLKIQFNLSPMQCDSIDLFPITCTFFRHYRVALLVLSHRQTSGHLSTHNSCTVRYQQARGRKNRSRNGKEEKQRGQEAENKTIRREKNKEVIKLDCVCLSAVDMNFLHQSATLFSLH